MWANSAWDGIAARASGDSGVSGAERVRTRVRKRNRLYLLSAWGALTTRRWFERVENVCLFIGYPKSGHTLVGSLLDAHPNAIIADEVNVLQYIQAGFARNQVFYLMLRGSRAAARAGRERTGYFYGVPGQWQGRFTELRLIGDKMGAATALRLAAFPALFDKLATLRAGTKFIHVVRNPYDVLSTMALRAGTPLEQSFDRFFSHAEAVAKVKVSARQLTVFDLKHEDFVADPKSKLEDLCRYLGLEITDDYLEDCSRMVYKSPHQSRFKAPWTPALIEQARERIDRFPFLRGYAFED